MSTKLKPWMKATFELIVHAETHLREGGDFDRRMARIGFDNAIEVAISTYLGLKPIQRNNQQYEREDIKKWTLNYHTKLDFLEQEAQRRGRALQVPNDEVIFYHEIRNDQYHAGGPSIPAAEHLASLRKAALDTFSILFDINDVEQVLEEWLTQRSTDDNEVRPRNPTVDKLLDMTGEQVNIFGSPYAVSEALFATDPESYHAVAAAVSESRNVVSELSVKYPEHLRPELTYIGFVHYEDVIYLKTLSTNGEIDLTDTDFISGESDGQLFTLQNSPDQNADRLIDDFDPYSIINCFEIFTRGAARRVARVFEASRSKRTQEGVSDGQTMM
jgi:hypothetical protein